MSDFQELMLKEIQSQFI